MEEIKFLLLENADNHAKRGESREGEDGLLEPFLSVDSLKLSDADLDEAEAEAGYLLVTKSISFSMIPHALEF